MKITKVCVIPDAHDGPNIPKDRFRWIGKHIKKTKPNHVVQIGDFLSFDSCCWHIDNATMQARKNKGTFIEDIDSFDDALYELNKGIGKTKTIKHVTLGNHEFRLWKWEDNNPADKSHSEEVDAVESSSSVALIYKPNQKFTNKFTAAKTYIKRSYGPGDGGSYNTVKDNYVGDRHALMYSGNYNFNLDNSVVFGLEREDDQIGYDENLTGMTHKAAYVTSSYFDFQSRITQNIYATFGARFDEHSVVGNEDSHRATLTYLFDDKSTKLKSSYGTGFRFPSLYEMYYVYAANEKSLGHVKAENSRSFDFGIEKSFLNLGFNIEASYFNLKYHDVLEGWKTGDTSGIAYTTQNMPGIVKSQGLELISQWKANDLLNFDFNYTYTSTYDGAEQDDPNPNANYYNAQMVRVPRNIFNLATNIKIPEYDNLDLTLKTKWSDVARDYGNGNRTFADERLDDYLVNDLSIKYNLMNTYNVFLDINNIMDEKYETARDYSQMNRSFNFGIRRVY